MTLLTAQRFLHNVGRSNFYKGIRITSICMKKWARYISKTLPAYEENGQKQNFVGDKAQGKPLRARFSSDFEKAFHGGDYVDKTGLIHAVHTSQDDLILSAPRRMGKSLNMNMLCGFYNGSCPREVFVKCKIGSDENYSNTMEAYGTYEVIYSNFRWFECIEKIKSVEDCKKALSDIMKRTFRQYKYILSGGGHDTFDDWERRKFNKFLEMGFNNEEIGGSLVFLAECLFRYHGKASILMIDEFDGICCTALMSGVDGKELDDIMEVYCKMVAQLAKFNTLYVGRSVLTGITQVTCKGMSELNNFSHFTFLDGRKFAEFYGIKEDEFKELITRPRYENRIGQADEAFNFYNGYVSGQERMLNTYSVMQFLRCGAVDWYWRKSVLVAGLNHVFVMDNIRNTIGKLLHGPIDILSDCVLTPNNLAILFKPGKVENMEIDSSFVMHFLLQQGYLVAENQDIRQFYMTVRIPNMEVRRKFIGMIRIYYTTICKISEAELDNCVKCFQIMNIGNVENCDKMLTEFITTFEKALETWEHPISELWLNSLLFSTFLKFDPLAGNTVYYEIEDPEKEGQAKKKYSYFDLLFTLKNKASFLFELKINQTSTKALEQIIERQYYKYEDVSKENYFLIGLNLDTECKKVSITYLRNSTKIEEKRSLEEVEVTSGLK